MKSFADGTINKIIAESEILAVYFSSYLAGQVACGN